MGDQFESFDHRAMSYGMRQNRRSSKRNYSILEDKFRSNRVQLRTQINLLFAQVFQTEAFNNYTVEEVKSRTNSIKSLISDWLGLLIYSFQLIESAAEEKSSKKGNQFAGSFSHSMVQARSRGNRASAFLQHRRIHPNSNRTFSVKDMLGDKKINSRLLVKNKCISTSENTWSASETS